MIKPDPGILSCVDERTLGRSPLLQHTLGVLTAAAGAGLLILLFGFLVLMSFWSSVASALEPARRSLRLSSRLTSWGRIVTIFYLGSLGSWSAPAVSSRPEPILAKEISS